MQYTKAPFMPIITKSQKIKAISCIYIHLLPLGFTWETTPFNGTMTSEFRFECPAKSH